MKVAFIGLGIMGSEMAAHLVKNGVDTTVWNRSTAPVQELQANGAKAASSANETVSDADIVFSMLSTPEVVKEIFFGETGCLSSMKNNAVWVDCSTVNPSFSLLANKEAKKYGIRFMDAPVAGTKPQAQNAELVFFVGAEKSLLSEVESFLNYMGNKIVHIGETGKGSSLKMLVNILLAESMVIFSEAVLFGEKMGISKDFLLDVLPNLVVAAPFTKIKANMIRADDYEVQFPLQWMHKDLHLAALTAYEMNQPLYLANLTKELFTEANKSGLGRLDFAAIHQYLSKNK